ncbi:hypothetical protein H6775_00760 [Candidatus Nomurabacteria bacterium]|nr:hypothetical protein [Candidatus Nomurabacteria bacterium]
MKKLITLFLLISIAVPHSAFAGENLFYFFNNVYGLSDFKKNYKQIDVVAPQIYEVGYDLNISKPKERKLIKESKKRKVKTVPLIVQDDFSKVLMSTILITPSAQDKIIDFMVKEAKKNDYAGWQFDFENINHLDRDMYVDFVKKTYERMQAEGLEFSVAVIVRSDDYDPNSKTQDWSSAYDYKKLAKYSDFLSLMTYDDPNSIGPVASLPYVKRILNYMLDQAPAEKLSLGIPAYCWQWQDGVRTNSTTYNLTEKAYKKAKKSSRSRKFDNELGAEVINFERDGVHHTIWCDNDQSFEMKQGIIDQYGLRGMSVWALGQGDKGVWSYLKKLNKSLAKK